MSDNILADAIGLIDDQLIEQYDQRAARHSASLDSDEAVGNNYPTISGKSIMKNHKRPGKAGRRIRIAAVTAAGIVALFAIGVLSGLFSIGLPIGGAQSGGFGSVVDLSRDPDDPMLENAPTYMYYTGPVFPLTLLEPAPGLTASRQVNYDFSPYRSISNTYEIETPEGIKTVTEDNYQSKALITDRYQLTNTTDQEITVKTAYPVAGSFTDLSTNPVTFSIDGRQVKPSVIAGPYSGVFEGAWGSKDSDSQQSLNLKEISSWLGYRQLLADGQYFNTAISPVDYGDLEVKVYEFSDFEILSGNGANPSLAVYYHAEDDVKVLGYGFHGIEARESGNYIQGFSLPQHGNEQADLPSRFCLIVTGGDITDIRLQGYENMGFDQNTEIEISAKITQYESTLNAMISELLTEFSRYYNGDNFVLDSALVNRTIYEQAIIEHLHTYGILADTPVDRYAEGWLEMLFTETSGIDRVIYLNNEIVVPAGSSVEIKLQLEQKGSHDFYKKEKSVSGAHGYDLTTRLGSSLKFTSQQAGISGADQIEILQQNYGFDPASGVKQIDLDLEREYYYMIVRKLVQKD